MVETKDPFAPPVINAVITARSHVVAVASLIDNGISDMQQRYITSKVL